MLSEKAIALYEILIILLLLFILIRQVRKKKDMQKRRQISSVKMRNEQLEAMLKNPDKEAEKSRRSNPYDVQYVHTGNAEIHAMPKFQVEIEVHTETSVQRYLFDLDQEVTIGRDEKNVLSINDRMAARRNCTIFVKNQAVYVKNQSSASPICIQRGKNKQLIQNQMVKLQSKDILTIGKTTLHISLYEN
jgi:hypothetical protein